MKAIERKILSGIGRTMLLALFGTALLSRCANTMAPQGGPMDTLPPKVVRMTPEFATLNFNEKSVTIEFDEYVRLKDLQKEFYTSPFMEKKPSVTIRGRGVRVDFQSPLDSNTTYSLNFGGSVVDNNEGNPYTGLRYVFSTGNNIDSMVMSGYTVNALTGDSIANTFVFFYDAAADSIPAYDSVLFKGKPEAIGRAFPNGIFIAENLKDKDYKVYAVDDANNNQTYEPGADRVAFLAGTFNPAKMPGFGVWYDTSRRYMQAEPQLYMQLFMDKPFRRQRMSSSERPSQQQLILNFTAPHPEILSLRLDSIADKDIIREYKTKGRDTIALWLAADPAAIPDTLKGEVIYMKFDDSLAKLRPDTSLLKLIWNRPFVKEKKQRDKDKEIADSTEVKEIEKERARDKKEKEPNPFIIKVDASAELNPEKNIPMTFDLPLRSLDSARVNLTVLEIGRDKSEKWTPARFSFKQDTANLRRWVFTSKWKRGEKYRLEIPAGVFTDIAGHSNDTLRSEFTIYSPDKFATLVPNLINPQPGCKYILQVFAGNTMEKEIRGVTGGKNTIEFITPGDIRIRVIEDKNGNGEWDSGSLTERRQPERIAYFLTEEGEDIVVAKQNWEIEFNIDARKLFAPITMESVSAEIRRKEEIRLREAIKSRLDRRLKPQNHNH